MKSIAKKLVPLLAVLSLTGRLCLKSAVSAPKASPVAGIAQDSPQLADLESYLADKVNGARRDGGVDSLVFDDALADVARAHSAEMRDKGYFAHESPTPELHLPPDRYHAFFHKDPLVIAENIYRQWGDPHSMTKRDIDDAHDALMKSPGHHANIMRDSVTHIGVGIVVNANGDFWVTEMFSKPQED